MTLLDTTDARNPTPYARELAEQHRARRARFWPAPVKALVAPVAEVEDAPSPYEELSKAAHRCLEESNPPPDDGRFKPDIPKAVAKVALMLVAEEEKKPVVNHVARVKRIIAFVAHRYRMSPSVLTGPSRYVAVSDPRHIAVYLSRKLTTRTLHGIGRLFNRDHSTILHSVQRTEREIAADPDFAAIVATLKVDIAKALAREEAGDKPVRYEERLPMRPSRYGFFTRLEDLRLLEMKLGSPPLTVRQIGMRMNRSPDSIRARLRRLRALDRLESKAIIAGEGK